MYLNDQITGADYSELEVMMLIKYSWNVIKCPFKEKLTRVTTVTRTNKKKKKTLWELSWSLGQILRKDFVPHHCSETV